MSYTWFPWRHQGAVDLDSTWLISDLILTLWTYWSINAHSETPGYTPAQRQKQMMSLAGVVIKARLGTVPVIWLIASQNHSDFLFHHKISPSGQHRQLLSFMETNEQKNRFWLMTKFYLQDSHCFPSCGTIKFSAVVWPCLCLLMAVWCVSGSFLVLHRACGTCMWV